MKSIFFVLLAVFVFDISLATPAPCVDTDANCTNWADQDQCQKNRQWMSQNCPVSCHTCPQSQTPPPPPPSAPDSCLMNCMNEVYKKGPMDSMKAMDIQEIKVGNMTAMCPRMNDTTKLDHMCATMKDLKTCTDPCTNTAIKNLTLSAFKATNFICIDRYSDIKKYMPCISDKCPDIQRTCAPKCGTVEDNMNKITQLLAKVHGANPPPAPGGTTPAPATNKDVDMSQIMKIIGDTCTSIGCFMSCSEAPITRDCGKDAYLLQRDMVWTMFSAAAQSMSSMGLQTQWPAECQPLAVSGGSGSPAPGTGTPIPGTTIVGTAPPPTGTAAPPPPATGAGKSVKTNATVDSGASVKCEKPPCGSSATLFPSILLLITALYFSFRK